MDISRPGEELFKPNSPNPKIQQSHYETLGINKYASRAEVRTSYVRMKNLLSNSAATYSLIKSDHDVEMRDNIEEAYRILGDKYLREVYDRELEHMQCNSTVKNGKSTQTKPQSGKITRRKPDKMVIKAIEKLLASEKEVNGQLISEMRNISDISKEEISANLKISPSYIDAIEDEDFNKLPPVVYVRGFLKYLFTYMGLKGRNDIIDSYIRKLENWKNKTKKKKS